MAQMPSPLDQDHVAHEPEQTLAALGAVAHPGEEPLASSEQQSGRLAGVGTASPANRLPELAPPSHSWSVGSRPSPCQADHLDLPPILWPSP